MSAFLAFFSASRRLGGEIRRPQDRFSQTSNADKSANGEARMNKCDQPISFRAAPIVPEPKPLRR